METIVWPAYINSNISRKDGRKINKNSAVSDPKLTEIVQAARKLNLNPKTEDDKYYPRFWWESSGRIIVERKDGISKNKILNEISETIKSLKNR